MSRRFAFWGVAVLLLALGGVYVAFSEPRKQAFLEAKAQHGSFGQRKLPQVQHLANLKSEHPERREISGLALYEGVSVQGVAVCLSESPGTPSGAPLPTCAWTDSEGTFRLSVFSSRSEQLILTAAASDGRSVRVEATNSRLIADSPLVLELRESSGLSGRILDGLGGVVGGALIVAKAVSPGQAARDCATAADLNGNYFIDVPRGQYEVLALADGYGRAHLTVDVPRSAMDLVLLPGAKVAGIVLAEGEEPVRDVLVSTQRQGISHSGGVARSGADGRFEIDGLAPGIYVLNLAEEAWESAFIEAVAQAEPTPAVLHAARALREEALILVGDRQCGAGSLVYDGPVLRGAETAISGQVSVGPLHPGRYQVTAHCEGALPQVVAVELPRATTEPVTWRLEAGRSVTGTIHYPDGAPLPQLTIQVASVGGEGRLAAQCQTNGEGRFECGGLLPGKYDLVATRGGRDVLNSWIEVPQGSDVARDWTIESRGTLRVAVAPGAGALVDVVAEGEGIFAYAETDGTTFWLRDLPAGRYSVRSRSGGSAVQVELRKGEVASVELSLKMSPLSGRALSPTGEPASDEWVLVGFEGTFPGAQDLRVLTDAMGNFSTPPVPEGSYLGRVEHGGRFEQFPIVTGTPATLELGKNAPKAASMFEGLQGGAR